MSAQQVPGYIKSSEEKWYERYPDLDARILCHIQEWRHSVEIGTIVSVADMMNFKAPGRHGMPGEIVLAHLFPEDGPCRIEGVRGIATQLTAEEIEAGYASPKFIQRTV